MAFLGKCFERVLLREKFLCGYGDRRGEASFAYESVDHIKTKLSNKKYKKTINNWPGDGLRMFYVLDL